MKKFDFSLQKILELKEQLNKNLRNELSEINRDIIAVEKKKAEIMAEYEHIKRTYENRLLGCVRPDEMMYFTNILDVKRRKHEELELKRLELEKKADKKKVEIIESDKEIKSYEKLKEKKYSVYAKESAKSEELRLQEFLSSSEAMAVERNAV